MHPDSQVFLQSSKPGVFSPHLPQHTHTHTYASIFTQKFISWKNLISGSEPVMELNHKMEPYIAEKVGEGKAENGGGGTK